MSIEILTNAPSTPAREAAIKSMRLAMAGDVEAWLDLFAEDALLQDPYGPSPMDPTGAGRVGKPEIAEFGAIFIRPDSSRFEFRQTLMSGHACVNIGTITLRCPEGKTAWTDVVNVYEASSESHTSELQSPRKLECRLMLERKHLLAHKPSYP